MSGNKHRNKFQKGRRRMKAINSPQFIMRGGFRL